MKFKNDRQRKKVMMMLKGSRSSSIPYIVSGSVGIKGNAKCSVYNVHAKNKGTSLKKSKKIANKNIHQFCNLADLKISSKKFTPKSSKQDVNHIESAGYERMAEILSQLIYNKSFSKLGDRAQEVLGHEIVHTFSRQDFRKFGRKKPIGKKYDEKIEKVQRKLTTDFIRMDKSFYKKLIKEINKIEYDGPFESVIDLAKSSASKEELLSELENAYYTASDEYAGIIADEADDAEYIRCISADKARLDKQYDKIVKMLNDKKFK